VRQFKRYVAWILFGMAFAFLVHVICRFAVEAYVARTGALSYLDYNQLQQFYGSVFIPHLIISLAIGILFGVWSAYQGFRFKNWEERFLNRIARFRGHWIVLSYCGIFLIAFGVGSFFSDFFLGLSWWFIILGVLIEIPMLIVYFRKD